MLWTARTHHCLVLRCAEGDAWIACGDHDDQLVLFDLCARKTLGDGVMPVASSTWFAAQRLLMLIDSLGEVAGLKIACRLSAVLQLSLYCHMAMHPQDYLQDLCQIRGTSAISLHPASPFIAWVALFSGFRSLVQAFTELDTVVIVCASSRIGY